MKQTWSIVIIGLNEEENIAGVIEKTEKVLDIISPEKSELIIVDDGSTDKTWDIIQNYSKKHSNIIPVRHPVNKGIGEALQTGYSKATCNNVGAIPADGQLDVEELLNHPVIPEKTILAFYRIENTEYSVFRNYLSWINKKMNLVFLGINMKDVNWFTVYNTSDLQSLNLVIKSSLVETEICSKLVHMGYKVLEVKSKYLPRTGGQSKGAFSRIVRQAVKDITKLIFEIGRFKRKLKK